MTLFAEQPILDELAVVDRVLEDAVSMLLMAADEVDSWIRKQEAEKLYPSAGAVLRQWRQLLVECFEVTEMQSRSWTRAQCMCEILRRSLDQVDVAERDAFEQWLERLFSGHRDERLELLRQVLEECGVRERGDSKRGLALAADVITAQVKEDVSVSWRVVVPVSLRLSDDFSRSNVRRRKRRVRDGFDMVSSRLFVTHGSLRWESPIFVPRRQPPGRDPELSETDHVRVHAEWEAVERQRQAEIRASVGLGVSRDLSSALTRNSSADATRLDRLFEHFYRIKITRSGPLHHVRDWVHTQCRAAIVAVGLAVVQRSVTSTAAELPRFKIESSAVAFMCCLSARMVLDDEVGELAPDDLLIPLKLSTLPVTQVSHQDAQAILSSSEFGTLLRAFASQHGGRLLSATEVLLSALARDVDDKMEEMVRYILIGTALEAIFPGSGNVTARISESFPHWLDEGERMAAHQTLRKVYDLRSAPAHGRAFKVSRSERDKTLKRTCHFYCKAVLGIASWLNANGDPGALESKRDPIADETLRRRLGLGSAPVSTVSQPR